MNNRLCKSSHRPSIQSLVAGYQAMKLNPHTRYRKEHASTREGVKKPFLPMKGSKKPAG
jgi:hypothetical protein